MCHQERAVRTRERLIRAAAEIFHREGFAGASLSAISSRAGVSNGALHFHFASKAALASAVEDAAALSLQAITRRAWRGASRLQYLVDTTHELAHGLRGDVVLRAGFGLSGDSAWAPQTDLRACWKRWVEEEVSRAAVQGELDRRVPFDGAVTTVVAATVGLGALGARDAGWLSRKNVAQFWLLVLPSLAAVPSHEDLEAGGSSLSH